MPEGIGERIKFLRQKRQFTLARLAEKSDLSASHLSQIERGKTSPSLMTLNSIAQALEINLRDLFESEQDQIYLNRTFPAPKAEETPFSMLPLTRQGSGWDLQVSWLSLGPGQTPVDLEPYPGEFLVFVLEGTLRLRIEGEDFALQAGDSLHSDARQQHRLCCAGRQPCQVIWCNSPPREDITAVERRSPVVQE